MILQDLKSNINRIDYGLKSFFENVYVSEKTSGNKFYFEIKANGIFRLDESSNQRREIVIRIDKSDILSNRIRWSYSSNPLNESSDWIERVSSLETLSSDAYEVVYKNRMDKMYLESLECIVESINESSIIGIENTLVENVRGILEKYGVKTIEIKTEIVPIYEGSGFPSIDNTLIIPHSSNLKISEMFQIECEIKSLPRVNWVLFKEGFIEINNSYEN